VALLLLLSPARTQAVDSFDKLALLVNLDDHLHVIVLRRR
jgi:hypothetical protein